MRNVCDNKFQIFEGSQCFGPPDLREKNSLLIRLPRKEQ